jgi:serine/threonine protein kinase
MPRDHAGRRVGTLLRDKYRIEQVIGAGGMATVYLAIHRNGNRVALKMLRPELSGHAAHRERFVREAYVANSLEHPGAVRVIDDDVAEDGCPFLVMELLVGETLEARRRRRGAARPARGPGRSATPCATCWPGPTRAAWSTATSSPTTSS